MVNKLSHLNVMVIVEQIKACQAKYSSIAVICKTLAESEIAYRMLKDKIDLTWIKDGNRSFQTGVVVIPSYVAKGIEFDAVLVFNASDDVYQREEERRLFYTICTRAMHELYLYSIGKPTGLLASVDATRYQKNKR
jgi:DNA helicase-2/ATP-dependent DNA helicase PcrA